MIGDILQPTHLLFVLVIALLVLGPKRLPEVGRSLGRGIRDFRTALSTDESERRDEIEPASNVATAPADAVQPVSAQPAQPVSAEPAPPQQTAATQPAAPEPVAAPAAPAESATAPPASAQPVAAETAPAQRVPETTEPKT